MNTDSEQLLAQGIATGVATFADFQAESGWSREQIQKVVCHQVGSAHRKLMLQAFDLPSELDYSTFPWLGNTGSVALPITLALALENRFIAPGEDVALLGIGSGINSVMLAVEFGASSTPT
jgi:3-oxoacyl-[acyl-carrier-protein] synthase-3